jgi:uncharacterized protein
MFLKPFLTLNFVLFFLKIYAQVPKELNSDVLTERLKNVENTEFRKILNSYNSAVKARPNDFDLQIERCKFVEQAQYDEVEEYNPNSELADSLKNLLYENFKHEPRVILFKISQLWGDDKKEYLEGIEEEVRSGNADIWTKKEKASFYVDYAKSFIEDKKYLQTIANFEEAIRLDSMSVYNIEYSKALIEVKRSKDAKIILNAAADTTQNAYYLMQKADLLMDLKDYGNATKLYNKILKINPDQINNENIAKAFVKIGQYKEARKFLLLDTAKTWNNLNTKLNLFLHDLEYQNASLGLGSYNAFRDQGMINDLFGIYRMRLFLKHPSAMWSFRDILSIFLFILLFLSTLVLPYVWLVPIKFSGEFLKLKPEKVPTYFSFDFKDIWFVYFVIVFATFSTFLIAPNSLYNFFGSELSIETLSDYLPSNINVAFTLVIAVMIFYFFRNKSFKAYLPNEWSLAKCFYFPFVSLWGLKFFFGIYARLMLYLFDINVHGSDSQSFILLSLNEEIINLIKTYGLGISIILVAIIAPIYEELIFRGVTLNGLISKFGFRYANIIQAILFGLAHQDLWLFPYYFLFGLFTANMLRKSGSILPCIIFHILNNLLATIAISYS